MTVLLLLCMCLPVGFEQPPVVNDITNQTSARNDDTNQQPGENQTATDLCQDLPPEHETTEGVWVCDPDGKTVDAEGNVIGWQWHGDEPPITPIECDEKPTDEQLAGTNIASALNKDDVILIQSDDEELESFKEDLGDLNEKLKMVKFELESVQEALERLNNSDLPEAAQKETGVHVEYELRYVENATEENSVTKNITWDFTFFPDRIEISNSGLNQDHGGGIVITVGNGGIGVVTGAGGTALEADDREFETDSDKEGDDKDNGDNNDDGVLADGEPSWHTTKFEVSNEKSSDDSFDSSKSVGYRIKVTTGVFLNNHKANLDGLGGSENSSAIDVDENGGIAIVTEMRFIFDAVEDNSTTDNQTLDGVEYELAEMNIIERKLCDVPEADDGKEEAESKDEGVFMKLGSSEVMNRDMAVGASVAIVTLLLSALVRSGGGGLLPRMVDKSDMVD